MTNALTMFDGAANKLPAHIANFFDAEGSNIADKLTVPSLSFEGKVWQISVNGDKSKLMKRNADGDEEPVSVLRVVVLDYAKRRGRAFYEGAYDPAKPGTPKCWSDDGLAPDTNVSEPQSTKCETCPMSVKGSKVSDNGKAVTACSQHRMLAVVPAHKLDFEPLRMKIAITSDFDKQSPDLAAQNWHAFSNYLDFLKSKGVGHTGALVTKMRFDPTVAYPKLIFSPDRWLETNELAIIAPVAKSEGVAKLLAGTWTPAGADGVVAASGGSAAATPVFEPQPEPQPEPVRNTAPATTLLDDDDDGGMIIEVTPVSVTVNEPAPSEKAIAAAAKKATAAKPDPKLATTAPVSTEVPNDVAALLAEWGAD